MFGGQEMTHLKSTAYARPGVGVCPLRRHKRAVSPFVKVEQVSKIKGLLKVAE